MSSNTTLAMNVAALVSGGKDSCYAILESIANGHAVTVLVNIQPPDCAKEYSLLQFIHASPVILTSTASCSRPLPTKELDILQRH